MLVNLNDNLLPAMAAGYAVGAFNTPNLESLQAVTEAAEELKVPVIVSHAQIHESYVPLQIIGPAMLQAAETAKVPVCVHLDHGTSFDYLIQAIRLGFSSVMYDGSALPYEQNVANTKEIVRIAHAVGVTVEAELGTILKPEFITGDVEESTAFTDPAMAEDFVEKTRVNALAVSFGTAHGLYIKQPKLDFDRIAAIHQRVPTPLVMHGGSGIGDDNYRRAIRSGITKTNYYTYMSKAGGEAAREYIGKNAPALFHEIAAAAQRAEKENVRHVMEVFRGPDSECRN